MKEFKIPVQKFDLEGFYKKTIEFIDNSFAPEFDSTFFIIPIDVDDLRPYDVPPEGWDALGALQRGEYLAFFPFALADDESTYCADGTVVTHPEEDWDEEDDDSEEGDGSDEEEGEEDAFFLRMEDIGGFLVQIKDGHIIINSAVHYSGGCGGPMPSVHVESDCGYLDEVMTNFVEGFMKPSFELVK